MPTTDWNERWARDLERFRERRRRGKRGGHYGDHWGDPSLSGLRYLLHRLRPGTRSIGNLSKVVRDHLEPYVRPDSVVLEIGAGGGRWTQYLIAARKVVVAELNPAFFGYLRKRFKRHEEKLRFYETSGYELDGIDRESIDFVFSFGTFVHIDPEGIDAYLGEIHRVLRPGGNATLQYADRTKPYFQKRETWDGFSDMNGPRMERLLAARGFTVVEHDESLLKHSNVVVFQRP
ncbi:MAG TPA: class I SAM-dependent methyltransferase [Solirubrobacteraceae bacterium]|nr:class I SAM-dependent methyltransferase [Solirubrobacteraceae bacterium]